MAWSKRLFQILLPLAIVAFGLRLFFLQSLSIGTSRFRPILFEGDFVLGVKSKPPERGQMVTYRCLTRPLCVGRVLGLPGDRLDISMSEVKINEGKILPRLQANSADEDAVRPASFAVVVSPDSYYLDGDEFGEVLSSQMDSVLIRVFVSVDPALKKVRWDRIWQPVH